MEWISVKERLPDDWAIVSIVEDNGYRWFPKIGEYRRGINKWFVEGCFDETRGWMEDDNAFSVTHWMPLPPPPMKFKDTPNVIDLTDFETPDCFACEEPTKRVSGKTFDVEGPGRVGVIYDCENRRCKAIKNAKGVFLMQSLRGENP